MREETLNPVCFTHSVPLKYDTTRGFANIYTCSRCKLTMAMVNTFCNHCFSFYYAGKYGNYNTSFCSNFNCPNYSVTSSKGHVTIRHRDRVLFKFKNTYGNMLIPTFETNKYWQSISRLIRLNMINTILSKTKYHIDTKLIYMNREQFNNYLKEVKI